MESSKIQAPIWEDLEDTSLSKKLKRRQVCILCYLVLWKGTNLKYLNYKETLKGYPRNH